MVLTVPSKTLKILLHINLQVRQLGEEGKPCMMACALNEQFKLPVIATNHVALTLGVANEGALEKKTSDYQKNLRK